MVCAMSQLFLDHVPEGVSSPATLVMLPGVNSGIYLFREALMALGQRHRLVIFNPPGIDKTPIPIPFTAEAYARYVLEVLNRLEIQNFHVFGHSLGGFAAQELARMAMSRIEKLVLVSSGIGQPITAQDAVKSKLKTGMDIWTLGKTVRDDPFGRLRAYFGPRYIATNPDGYTDFIQRRATHLPPRSISLAQVTAGGVFSSYKWAHTIRTPTLIIHGTADVLLTDINARTLAEKMPNARYLELYDVGHFPMLEHDGFYAAVDRFLCGHPEGAEVLESPESWLYKCYKRWFLLRG